MSKKDPRIDAYIAKAADFAQPILHQLRTLIHQGCPEIEETIKWGMPHFIYHGSILCSIASFKAHCAFRFWNGDLLFRDNPAAQKKAAEAMGHFGRITSLADLPPKTALLHYIKQAARLRDQGTTPPARANSKRQKPLDIPDYVTAALRGNKQARHTFDQFSYSHKKEYLEWITEAKRDDTRARRLETALEWLAQGKPRHWKYTDCR